MFCFTLILEGFYTQLVNYLYTLSYSREFYRFECYNTCKIYNMLFFNR